MRYAFILIFKTFDLQLFNLFVDFFQNYLTKREEKM